MIPKRKNFKDVLNPLTVEKFNEVIVSQTGYKIELTKHLNGGDHLLFFNPTMDGRCEDAYYKYLTPGVLLNKKIPFKRRLWTQGSIEYRKPMEYLKSYSCFETVEFVKEMKGDYFVKFVRQVSGVGIGVFLQELRTLIYTNKAPSLDQRYERNLREAKHVVPFIFSALEIFKYSCLSSNPHRIHWDVEYCTKVEGYKDIVVQGPFILHLALKTIEAILCCSVNCTKYKNSQVLYKDTAVEICLGESKGSEVSVWVRDAKKKNLIYMDATAVIG